MSKNIVTRFAVSPTGYMHVGGVRNALFDWLVAKQSGGKFILRIEDTDQKRHVAEATDHIIRTLSVLGLDWDEGPDKDGPNSPYIQSERLGIYKEWADKLVEKGLAYADPYTPAEVQAFREECQKNKQPFLFRNYRPDHPPVWDGSQPLRLRSSPKTYTWTDEVMGELSAGEEAVDDFVLMKSDGYPTYNFCHIIDDYLMGVTHVIRSQEFIASMPKFLNLYDVLDVAYPKFATLPFIMNQQGNKKLSKRDGAKDVLDYIDEGFLPEALLSFIATLGWNDGTEQEVFTVDELINKFSLARVGKGGAAFDEKRLSWVNGHFIRQLPLDELYTRVAAFWPEEASSFDDHYKKQVLSLVQERLKYFAELPELTLFFFKNLPVNLDLISNHKQLKKLDKTELIQMLELAKTRLEESDFTVEDLQSRLNQLLEETGQKPAVMFSLIRIATTWAPASPELAGSLAVLGKNRVLEKISEAIKTLSK